MAVIGSSAGVCRRGRRHLQRRGDWAACAHPAADLRHLCRRRDLVVGSCRPAGLLRLCSFAFRPLLLCVPPFAPSRFAFQSGARDSTCAGHIRCCRNRQSSVLPEGFHVLRVCVGCGRLGPIEESRPDDCELSELGL